MATSIPGRENWCRSPPGGSAGWNQEKNLHRSTAQYKTPEKYKFLVKKLNFIT
jgi:hypothetical protein